MLAAGQQSKTLVDAARARLETQLAAHAKLRAAASHSLAETQIQAFEQGRLADMLIALDAMTAHRTRGVDGKDGNPLNEMRMITASLMAGDGVLAADPSIRYDPDKAVLGVQIGQAITLTAPNVKKLGAAFLDEVERRYGD